MKCTSPIPDRIRYWEATANNIQDLGDKINEELKVELNNPPQNNDPSDWEAFLASEGLINDDFLEDDL